MGNKKHKRKQVTMKMNARENLTDVKYNTKPRVSVCTPTFNRRPFIKAMIRCFEHQDYPKELLEWIIIDDGTDKIEDLVMHIPQVKYFKYDKKMPLGKKRNLMHEKTAGDILVYMDDDDYYPPDRISHAVKRLQSAPNALCAGSSELFCFFKDINKMYKFGPYSPTHSTAGTFAFKRKLLSITKYDEDACLAEEKQFLHDYTIPFVQLDPMKTILVFAHDQNTFDKRNLLKNPNQFVNESKLAVTDFISDKIIIDLYINTIPREIENYAPGRPEMKPDVIKQLAKMTKEREEMAQQRQQQMQQQQMQSQMQQQMQQQQMQQQQMQQQMQNNIQQNPADQLTQVIVQQDDGTPRQLTTAEVVNILEEQQNKINELSTLLMKRDQHIKRLELVSA
jgi:glycosyltransferase involved in cell wall biosynthesis